MHSCGRTTPRFNLNVSVRVRRLDESGSTEYTVETSNLSGGGIYFSSDVQVELDNSVRAYLLMPEQIFGKPIVR
jgi:PilZ domain